ncbi:MAG: ATP-binding protein [Polyangiaceae bacterium]|nr:ATP-binding protein [Polyangiaceae bacterium]
MDLRTRTIMLCAAFAAAITVSVLLRPQKNRTHYLFSAFAGTTAVWYLVQGLFRFYGDDIWYRLTAALAVLMPQISLHLFESIAPHRSGQRTWLLRVAALLGVPMFIAAISRFQPHALVRTAIILHVIALVSAGLVTLAIQGQRAASRAIRERVRLLVGVGALALFFSTVDFVWFIGAELPPVGAVLSIVFLYALAESLWKERLVDLYEWVGHLIVSTALAFCLAGVFYTFVTYVGFDTMYLNAVLAAVAILVLFEPLRSKVEEQIHVMFFRQRRDLDRVIHRAEQTLVHVLELDDMGSTVIGALEQSRRATSAALYLLDQDGRELSLRQSFGGDAVERVDAATARPLLDSLREVGAVAIGDGVDNSWNPLPHAQSGVGREALLAASKLVGSPVSSGVILGIRLGARDMVGLLLVCDDRVRDAFSADETVMLVRLASMIGVVVENTRVYARMKERDRMAVLGQMAAGLAHEIKNPLGSIKGAAQLLVGSQASDQDSSDSQSDGLSGGPASAREFLEIILEEVDRLDRVVGSVLDYARPMMGNPEPVDVNAVVMRTVQILGVSSVGKTRLDVTLGVGLPMVRVDAEHLRQVIMNLVRNAIQAIGDGGGVVTVLTGVRDGDADGVWRGTKPRVEVVVRDTGPGISPEALNSLFVPFFSTKADGTGLGLSISQRIVQEAGGVIDVVSPPGEGAEFRVILPACLVRDSRPPIASGVVEKPNVEVS